MPKAKATLTKATPNTGLTVPPVGTPVAKKGEVRTKNWCYTLNNYSEAEYDSILALECTYHVCGKEVGSEGTPHLQGYIVFNNVKPFNGVKRLMPRAHLEAAKGNSEQNLTYCSKGGDYVEKGTRPLTFSERASKGGEAEEERWKLAKAAAIEGRLDDVPEDIFVRYYRVLKNIREDYAPTPEDLLDTTGVWILGPTGVGKSHLARQVLPDLYDKCCNKWWDGYIPGHGALLDDLDLTHAVLGHHIKRWADRYAYRAEVKGGTVNLRPPVIIVTSQYCPQQIWEELALQQAIARRFHIIEVRWPSPTSRANAEAELRAWLTARGIPAHPAPTSATAEPGPTPWSPTPLIPY